MHRGNGRRWAVGVITAGLVAAGGAASADPGETTHVDEFTATLGNSIAVSGQATFVDAPLLVADDPISDSLGSNTGGLPLGDELTTATISRPDPFKNTLTFSLGIGNQPPALNGTPEIIHYLWNITVDDQETLTLQAIRTGQWARLGTGEVFQILRCSGGNCNRVAEVPGMMADGVVEWQVKMNQINATTGSVIIQESVMSTVGASGLTWFTGGVGVSDQAFPEEDFYTVPGPSVKFGIAPAGTPPQQVLLTTDGTVDANGAFSGLLPAPAEPGDYTVVVQACQGPSSCGLASTGVTIPAPA